MAIQRKLSLAIRLINRFGTKNITHALVTTEHGTVAINKKDGHYIFTDLHPLETFISIRATGYDPVDMQITEWYAETGQALPVLLTPVMHINADFTITSGRLLDGKSTLANQPYDYAIYPPSTVTLQKPVKQNENGISVSVPRWLRLEGQRVALGESSQIYTVLSYDADEDYFTLDRPLADKGFLMGTPIHCVYEGCTDTDGYYKIFSHLIYSSRNGILYAAAGKKAVRKEFTFGEDVQIKG